MGRPIPYKTDSSVFLNVGLRRASAANAANNDIAQKLCHSERSEESPQLLQIGSEIGAVNTPHPSNAARLPPGGELPRSGKRDHPGVSPQGEG